MGPTDRTNGNGGEEVVRSQDSVVSKRKTENRKEKEWIPAFAGMTNKKNKNKKNNFMLFMCFMCFMVSLGF